MNPLDRDFLKYYIQVTDIKLFNNLVAAAEDANGVHFEALRQGDLYILRTQDEVLWQELFLYGQMLAHAQGEWIEGGEAH